jgi:hypothetical protein
MDAGMDSPAEPVQSTPRGDSPPAFTNTLDWRGKVYILLGTILSIGIIRFVANAIHLPPTPHSSISMLQQTLPVVALAAILITFLICTTAATIITASVREEAGLLCAAIALAALSLRGGTLREALLAQPDSKVYLQLALESFALIVMLSLAAAIVSLFRHIDWLRDDDLVDGFTGSMESPGSKADALLVALMAYLAIIFLLAQTDRKAQVLAAAGIAGVLSTLLAHYLFPVKPAGCFYLVPLLGAIVGNVILYFTHPAGHEIGQVYSRFAPLARPLPLDHASAGVAGSLVGYWLSRRMHVTDAGE